jgi:hypothetical protein
MILRTGHTHILEASRLRGSAGTPLIYVDCMMRSWLISNLHTRPPFALWESGSFHVGLNCDQTVAPMWQS